MQKPWPKDSPETNEPVLVHASCVAVEGKGLLITGPSGAGKSSIALEMMAMGAGLVSDDQTLLQQSDNQIIASCPTSLEGRIEARGIGILRAAPTAPTPIRALLDLTTPERDRLPPFRETVLLGQPVALLHKTGTDAFPAALVQYLKAGRQD